MPKFKRQHKACVGCDDHFTTFRNYDYCPSCEVNGSRYLNRESKCSECDGSGWIKFRGQPKRPCKLCALTKPMKRKTNPKKITAEPELEKTEEQFWNQVEKKSKSLIANLIEQTLPISAVPSVFDCERDVDYRILLRSDLPNYYYYQEDYQEKIAQQNWTENDVAYVAQDLVGAYFDLVVKALVERLREYPTFANTSLAQKF